MRTFLELEGNPKSLLAMLDGSMVYIRIRKNIFTPRNNGQLQHFAEFSILSFMYAQWLNILSLRNHISQFHNLSWDNRDLFLDVLASFNAWQAHQFGPNWFLWDRKYQATDFLDGAGRDFCLTRRSTESRMKEGKLWQYAGLLLIVCHGDRQRPSKFCCYTPNIPYHGTRYRCTVPGALRVDPHRQV